MSQEAFQTAREVDRLSRAVIWGEPSIVLEEIRSGKANPNFLYKGRSLLHHAGERGFKDIARILIDCGANVDQIYGKQCRSLLHFAAATYRYGFASVLLDAGANPTPLTTSKSTPLHFSARMGQEYMSDLLCRHGADIDAQDSRGRTPVLIALKNGHTKLAKQLISLEANPSLADHKGNSPRKVAEKSRRDSWFRNLIYRVNIQGKLAIQLRSIIGFLSGHFTFGYISLAT